MSDKNNKTLKPGWRRVKFGEVVRLSKARSQDPLADGIERYVGLEHLEPGDLRIRSWGSVADGVTFTSVFQPGQVLFGKRRAYQRKVAVADFSGVCSGDIYVLETKDAQVLLPELLPFICQTDAFFALAVGTSAGSLSPRTNWTSLASYEFFLPPLQEQRRILVFLKSFQSLVQANEKATAAAKSLLDSFVAEKMAAFIKEEKRAKFDDVCIRITDGTHQPPKFSDSGVPFLLVSNLSSGEIDWSVEKWVSEVEYEALTKSFKPQAGDVLLTLVGSFGVPVLVDWKRPFTFQRHIGVLRPDSSKLRGAYLYHFLCSPYGQWQCTKGAEGLAQKTITLKSLKEFDLPLPSLDEQDSFISEVSEYVSALASIETRKQKSTTLLKISREHALRGTRDV